MLAEFNFQDQIKGKRESKVFSCSLVVMDGKTRDNRELEMMMVGTRKNGEEIATLRNILQHKSYKAARSTKKGAESGSKQ